MTNIYFVRHAKPDYDNHDDMTRELSEQGQKDRKLVTEFLRDKDISVILSSPYKRAVDTIKEFADALHIEVELDNDFRERKVGSAWIEDFDGFSRKQWEDFDYKLPDGESLREVQRRNISALNGVLKKYPDKNIVIGSHGTALSTIINYYDPAFCYDDFIEIVGLMPWIVKLVFDKDKCREIVKYNILK